MLSAIPVSFCLCHEPSERRPNRQDDGGLEQVASETLDRDPPAIPDPPRRLALAKWIADPANPLPARVIVNRLWLYHFGEGLVSTPSDFGVNGARPTHPELLDWLAAELIQPTVDDPAFRIPHSLARRSDPSRQSAALAEAQTAALRTGKSWSIKHIQRLIVTSATYRQASVARPKCLAADAGARLLWRFPPRRLEAEPLRDIILAISGNLDLRMGGPGFSLFEPNDNYVRVYNPKQEFGPTEWRRMIYMTKVRMHPDGIFGAFDCPDGGQIAPKRMRSTTPLQALNLLNSGFILQQADRFASRLEHEAGPGLKAQVRLAFELAFSRPPEPAEASAAEQLATGHGLPVLCRALFNSNEFVFME